ncbi:MAG: DUF790 family protein [Phycisphaerae bacterium]|nr:DUF790 family protein [Phycisphaerae bacterium]
MLSKELALYTCSRGRAYPDCLTRDTHAHYVPLVEQLLAIYRCGKGATREQLHRHATAVFNEEPQCPPQRIRSFIRLLDQAAEYQTDIDGRAYRLRQRVFDLAAQRHPLVVTPDTLFEHAEREVKKQIAGEVGMPWLQLERAMYADLPAFHRLKKMEGYSTAEELLRRYNVAQAQTLLFWAEEMTVMVRDDFRKIFRHAKFNRLLHETEAVGLGKYRVRFSGPASVLRQTRRYGVDMAKFLPGLLACRGWDMSARLRLPYGIATFKLSPRDRLHSHLSPDEEFDSEVERIFAERFGPERDGWCLQREGGFLARGQKVFVPDFVFRHTDGTVVYLEIVGFWTPEYLERKAQTLALFKDTPIIVAVAGSVADKLPLLPTEVITYKTRLKIKPVLERLEALHASGIL